MSIIGLYFGIVSIILTVKSQKDILSDYIISGVVFSLFLILILLFSLFANLAAKQGQTIQRSRISLVRSPHSDRASGSFPRSSI